MPGQGAWPRFSSSALRWAFQPAAGKAKIKGARRGRKTQCGVPTQHSRPRRAFGIHPKAEDRINPREGSATLQDARSARANPSCFCRLAAALGNSKRHVEFATPQKYETCREKSDKTCVCRMRTLETQSGAESNGRRCSGTATGHHRGGGSRRRRGGGGTRGRDAVAKESPGPGGRLVQGSGEALQVPPGAALPLADQKSQLQESPVTRGPPPRGPSLCPGLARTPSPAKRRIPGTSGPPPGAAPMGGAALQGSWWELASLDTPLGERGPAGRPGTRKARAAPCWEVFGQSPLADLRSAPSWGCHHICGWAGSGKALRPAAVSRGCELAHSMHLSPPGLKP